MVQLPPDRNAISNQWVQCVKAHADGSIDKLKAKLVAKEFQQKEETDYGETFAPVVRWNTLKSVVALGGDHGWDIFHLDLKTTFLNMIAGPQLTSTSSQHI